MQKNISPRSEKYISILFLFLFFFSALNLNAQRRNKTYDDYIDKYKILAVDHMKKYKIPASITLAQGLLESGAGMSTLTKKSNNHFGIKCHNDWKGETVRAADDGPNDCFRKYKKPEQSFEDHSLFLSKKKRYHILFSLKLTNYKGWARGLQKAGYATDKAYANKLIKLIEDYELYIYDKKNWEKEEEELAEVEFVDEHKVNTLVMNKHIPYITNDLVYVIAKSGDTYEAIAKEFHFKVKDLYKYNEVPKGFPLSEGDIVYFQRKKTKSDKPYYEHIVQVGQSMYSISQLYGVRLMDLYKRNKKDMDYVPIEGDVLKLR